MWRALATPTAIQPYALKLFVALLFIEVLVTCLQFMLDQGDAPHYLGRLFRHVLSAGFIYLMIVNAFPWMTLVLQSFGQIGSAATGLPNLNPSTVVKIGGSMAETIFDTPASASLMPNIELAIVESVSAFFILLSFVIAAAALMLTLIESYLVIGGAALLLGFGASRWTASIAEGYFGYVVRVGTRLLFFYLVLGIGVQIATQWQAALTAACNPVATALPWFATYGAPPKAIMTTVCSNTIPGPHDARSHGVVYCFSNRDSGGAVHSREHRERYCRSGAQPRFRGRLRRADDRSAYHERAPDRIQQGRADRQRYRRHWRRTGWLGKGNGLRPTDAATRQSRFRRRTARAGTEGCSRHIGHAVARSEYHADESRHSALWERQQHNDDGQSDQQNLRGLFGLRRIGRARLPAILLQSPRQTPIQQAALFEIYRARKPIRSVSTF